MFIKVLKKFINNIVIPPIMRRTKPAPIIDYNLRLEMITDAYNMLARLLDGNQYNKRDVIDSIKAIRTPVVEYLNKTYQQRIRETSDFGALRKPLHEIVETVAKQLGFERRGIFGGAMYWAREPMQVSTAQSNYK